MKPDSGNKDLQDEAVRKQADREKPYPAKEKIDLKKLVIYSEIMSPKFKE